MRPADRIVLALLVLASFASIAFIAVYVMGNDTQLYGITLGLAFVFLALAAIVAGKKIVDQRKAVEERRPVGVTRDAEQLMQTVDRIAEDTTGEPPPPVERISRRTLLVGVAGAGVTLGAALVVPIASIGKKVGDDIVDTPWEAGRLLVDDQGNPLTLDDIVVGTYLPAFPEGADRRDLGSPLVVVRILPEELDLPPGRQTWSVDGVLAFSRICPHAGCAISLFRYPLYEPTSPSPALVCPCHYSTFDVRNGGERIFGPAGRALPQLPLALDDQGRLIANGEFSSPPGPSYLSTRRWKPEDNPP